MGWMRERNGMDERKDRERKNAPEDVFSKGMLTQILFGGTAEGDVEADESDRSVVHILRLVELCREQ